MKKFLMTWNEFWTLPIALVLWVLSPYVLRWMDPTAAVFDTGVLQSFLFAVIGMLLFNGMNWALLRVNFPSIYKYIDDVMEGDLCSIERKHWRVGLAMFFYLVQLALLVALVKV